ncbi:hypothetical protein LX36DRAFT_655789 [Colletotrichum falcatum]|nr:hypothetical protein LX36DRAFT_655789 [Colletotrichum falcatum]
MAQAPEHRQRRGGKVDTTRLQQETAVTFTPKKTVRKRKEKRRRKKEKEKPEERRKWGSTGLALWTSHGKRTGIPRKEGP